MLRRSGGAADEALAKIDVALETLRNEFRILAPYEMTGPVPRARRVHVKEIAELALELNRGLLARSEIGAGVEGEDWEARLKVTPLLQILDNLVHNACSWVSTTPPGATRRIGIVTPAGVHRQRVRHLREDLHSGNFFRHLEYFVTGPQLPDEVASRFSKLAADASWHFDPLRSFVRMQATRLSDTPARDYLGEEFFKLALECGLDLFEAKMIRTDAMNAVSRSRRKR